MLASAICRPRSMRSMTFEAGHGAGCSAAFRSLTAPSGRVLTVLIAAPAGASAIEVTMDEAPLQNAMSRLLATYLDLFACRLGHRGPSAALALHRMILQPVRRLTTSIMDFGADPGDRSRIINPSKRMPRIGQAERALAVMQEALALELSEEKPRQSRARRRQDQPRHAQHAVSAQICPIAWRWSPIRWRRGLRRNS